MLLLDYFFPIMGEIAYLHLKYSLKKFWGLNTKAPRPCRGAFPFLFPLEIITKANVWG